MSLAKPFAGLGLFLTLVVLSAPAFADNKRSLVVFDTWVEVPGGVIPGGRYIFEVRNTKSDQHQVAIFDEVTGIYIATVPTIPIERSSNVEQESIRFEERPYPNPEAVKAWFRPGSRIGEQFIYPQNEGLLAQMTPPSPITQQAAQSSVAEQPAMETPRLAEQQAVEPQRAVETPQEKAVETAPTQNGRTPVVATPDAGLPQTTQPLQASEPVSAPANSPSSDVETRSLPKTASSIALVTFTGGLALVAALLLQVVRRMQS